MMAGILNEEKDIIDKLEEYVIQENKVVTYKWLSKTLGLDCNLAKQFLSKFLDKYFSSHKIFAYYVLTGVQELTDGSKVHKIVITSDKNLEKRKSLFSVLTSCHVYCVQLSKVQDPSILYTAEVISNDKDIEDFQKYSAVKYNHVKITPKKRIPETKSSVHECNTNNDVKSTAKTQASTKSKQNGLFNIWQKQQTKTNKTDSKSPNSTPVEITDEGKAKQNGLFNMWQKKQTKTNQREEKSKSAVVTEEINKQNEVQLEEKMQFNSEQKGSNSTKTSNHRRKDSKRKKSNSTREGKLNSSSKKSEKKRDRESILSGSDESDEKPNKKQRKRIMLMSESESESEESSSSEEEFKESKKLKIDLEESEEEVEDTEEVLPAENSKVSYKTVSKTFLDEDGFMVTKKVKECIEEMVEEEKQPVKIKSSIPLAQSSEKLNQISKKQSSLMNFFMKK